MAYEPPRTDTGMSPDVPGTMEAAGTGGLLGSYRRVVLNPSIETFEAEAPRASWGKVLIGVGAIMLVVLVSGLLVTYVYSRLWPDMYNLANLRSAVERQFSSIGLEMPPLLNTAVDMTVSTSGISSILLDTATVPVRFFVGAALLFMAARIFGGRGGSFLTHAYLLSLSYTPLRAIATLVNLIPFVGPYIGWLVTIALIVYQLYLAGVSMQVSQRMLPGKAMAAAFVPAGVITLLVCAGLVAVIAMLAQQVT